MCVLIQLSPSLPPRRYCNHPGVAGGVAGCGEGSKWIRNHCTMKSDSADGYKRDEIPKRNFQLIAVFPHLSSLFSLAL